VRLQVKVNGAQCFVAAVPGAGFLSSHLNLSNRPKEGTQKRRLRVEGIDTNSVSETRSLSWTPIELTVGDVVQLEILEDGPGDPPARERSTRDAPTNLFEHEHVAGELLELSRAFEKQLFEFLAKVEKVESAEEHAKFKRALGSVIVELYNHFFSPVWRRHAALIPEEAKGEML
jgi:hypothetical protein